MDLLLAVLAIAAAPWLLFVVPLQYGDKISKGMLEDSSLNPVDYTE